MARRFSSSNRCWRCFTDLEPARMSKECLVTFLGMPGMSEGLHANTSVFARRKSTRTTSYLGSRLELILNTLPFEASGLRKMSLVSSAGSKLPTWRLGSAPPNRDCRGWRSGTPSRLCPSLLNALDVALVGMLARRADGDDAVGSRHLELEVGVVGDGHELGVTWRS